MTSLTPIIPTTLDDVWRLATAVTKSGLAPETMKTPEQVTVAILHGLEIGLPPMQAVQRIAVVNGRPAIWGDAIPALVLARGFRMHEYLDGAGDARVAWCEVTRPDGQVIKRKFSVEDAKRAKLWQTQEKVRRKTKAGEWYEKENDSPWYRYPERMLQMRARGLACRDGAADALSGMYLREEIDDEPAAMKDITPPPKAAAKALELPDIPDEPEADDTAEARKAISEAISTEMLAHMREAYPEADWEVLALAYDAKHDELSVKQAAE